MPRRVLASCHVCGEIPVYLPFFVRDMVEKFEIEVPYVPTDHNPADFFTKPMKSASRFRELCATTNIVMNIRD